MCGSVYVSVCMPVSVSLILEPMALYLVTIQSGALMQSEFIQWAMDHTDLSMQLANILFEVTIIYNPYTHCTV